jgi:hypothetical protein
MLDKVHSNKKQAIWDTFVGTNYHEKDENYKGWNKSSPR